MDVFSDHFQELFESAKANIKDDTSKDKFQQFLCYELRRGTSIPAGVGIEMDGDNHVCLYPIGDHNNVSNVAPGGDTFVIDLLQNLAGSWRPFALLKFRANGYHWPDINGNAFPPDSKIFPIRQWVEAVVISGEADLSVSVSCYTEDFAAGALSWIDYFKELLSIGGRFGLMCSYEHCIVNSTLMTALRFALNCAQLANDSSQW